MIDLNKEAENFIDGEIKENIISHHLRDITIIIYKSGANSKYAQAKIIQAQIDILNKHIEHPSKPGYKRHDILNKIKELKSKLNNIKN